LLAGFFEAEVAVPDFVVDFLVDFVVLAGADAAVFLRD
jgi:hypothetical protein